MIHEAGEVVVLDPTTLDVAVFDVELCAALVEEDDAELVWLEEEDVGLVVLVPTVGVVCEVVPTGGGAERK